MKRFSLLLAFVAVVPISATFWSDVSDTFNNIEIPSIIDDISKLPGQASDGISKISNKASNGLSKLVDQASDEISKPINKAADELSKLPGRASDEISKISNKASDELSKLVDQASNEISKPINKASDELSKLPGRASDELSNLAEKAATEIKKVPRYLLDQFPPIDLPNLPLGEVAELAGKYCKAEGSSVQCHLPLIIAEKEIASIHLNMTIPENEIAYHVSLSVNNDTVFEDRSSMKDPSPMCLTKTRLSKILNLCVRMHSLLIKDGSFYGCLSFDASTRIGYLSRSLEAGCIQVDLATGKPKYETPKVFLH